MKSYVFLLVLFISSLLPAQKITLLPEKVIFDKYYADALSHQFSISKHLESSEWFGNVGISIPAFNLEYKQHLLQISAASTIFNTVIKTPGHIQVYTVDYLVDFFFDYNISTNIPVRFVFGHLSAHYSDDGITELNNYPISYVRDYVGLHIQYLCNDSKVYAGFYHNFHIEPEAGKQNNFQFGADKFFRIYDIVEIYGAIDMKMKAESDFTPVQSYQAGFRLSHGYLRALRFAYTFRSGFEERGQLYDIRDKKQSLGIFLDI
jgi:hypothetical protein